MNLKLSRRAKIGLMIFVGIYIAVGVVNVTFLSRESMSEAFKNIANRWVVKLPFGEGILSRINPLTLIMTWTIMIVIIVAAAKFRKFRLVPDRKQSAIESLLQYVYEIVEGSIPDERFVRPTFYIACTLFVFVAFSNVLGGAVPGVSLSVSSQGDVEKVILFSDPWFSPTADINTNASLAVFVLIISHAFAIKAKGFKAWLKTWFEPNPIMFPMNVVGELAKPISHSLRLFGNIAGGAMLVYMLSYMVKYLFMPVVLWGFFGLFIGLVQALVFTVLAVAYISAALS